MIYPFGPVASRRPNSTAFLLFLVLAAAFLSGCVAPYHYRAYLLESADDGKEYTPKLNNAISIKPNQRIQLTIPQVRVGFTHREMNKFSGWGWDKKRGPYAFEFDQFEGLGGRDYWILSEIVSLDHNDPLGLRQSQVFKASYVKQDQQSYGFLPLEKSEQIILDTISKTSSQVTIKIYSVHGMDAKRMLYELGSSNIASTAWNAGVGFLQATGNFLAKDILDAFKGKIKKDPQYIERLLLQANAELEFNGRFQLVLDDSAPDETREYLLYDIAKSHLDRDANQILDDDARARVIKLIEDNKIALADAKGTPYSRETLPDDALLKLPASMKEYESQFQVMYNLGPYKTETEAEIKQELGKKTFDRDKLTRSYVKIGISSAESPEPE